MLQKWSVDVVGLDFKCFQTCYTAQFCLFSQYMLQQWLVDVVGLDLNCFNHL
jgi:hypothetical protein